MSPPGLGRSSSALAFRVVAVFGFSGFTSGASPVTTMFPFSAATFRTKLTDCFCPNAEKTEF